ncbi:MAG: GFA family protein [Paracoccaceae bacterium]
MDGGCCCGKVRYRMTKGSMFTHACHCTWCQRETGAPHALNAMVETDALGLLQGTPVEVTIPSASGQGQIMVRCPECQITLWSYYGAAGGIPGRKLAFVRVGTLDDPALCPPDIHIYTSTKLPWYVLNDDIPAVAEYYQRSLYWPAESLARRRAALEG